MRRVRWAALLLTFFLATPAFSGSMSTLARTSYDIETDNVSSYASFVYTPSWIEDFIGARYRYEPLVVLDPDAYWNDVTYSNAWAAVNSVPATPGRCYSTLLSIQQFDADDGSREGSYYDESEEVCAPQRCLVVIQEFWSDGSMHMIDAGWYRVGASYTYTAYDYPDMLFLYWDGDVHSSNRTISGYLSGTSFYAAAVYGPKPCNPSTDRDCACDPNTDPSCCDPADPYCGLPEPPNPGNPPNSPIILNLGRGDYRLTGSNSPVLFDIAASGTPARIGWTEAGSDQAFLCLDRNGNGVIDDGAELFGTATRLGSGSRAPNGFVALAEYDDNGDRVIDERDAVWPLLLLWRDLNHDGISQAAELTPIATSGVKGIALDVHWSGRRDRWGNMFRYQSLMWIKDGGSTTARPLYDVFFVAIP